MSLIPTNWHYVTILAFLSLLTATIFSIECRQLLRRPRAYLALSIYLVGCTVIDLVAVELRWWTFDSDEIVGLYFLSIPIEEYGLFLLTFLLTIGLWELRLK